MRFAILACFALGCLVACDDGERRKEKLESKYRDLANRCLSVGMQLKDAWQCLTDAGATTQYYTYSDTIVECTGGGWFEGPEICGGIAIRFEWREDFPSSVITGWQVEARERTRQKGFAR